MRPLEKDFDDLQKQVLTYEKPSPPFSDYIISSTATAALLTQMVRPWLANGWEPVGGPFVFNGEICQAMIKRASTA